MRFMYTFVFRLPVERLCLVIPDSHFAHCSENKSYETMRRMAEKAVLTVYIRMRKTTHIARFICCAGGYISGGISKKGSGAIEHGG